MTPTTGPRAPARRGSGPVVTDPTKYKQVSLRYPVVLHQRMQAQAVRLNVSDQDYIRLAVAEKVERDEKASA